MGIKLMGIEFEGGWDGERGVAPFNDASIKYDGSVRLTNVVHYGEVCSEPLRPDHLIDWAVTHVPHKVNRSCGTHVHISFDKRSEYSTCVNRKYMDGLYEVLDVFTNEIHETNLMKDEDVNDSFFIQQMRHRLGGGNTYCNKRFVPVRQLQDTSRESSRYSGINYCHKLHGTIEIRVLPGISSGDIVREVLSRIITFTEQYLQDNAHKQRIRFRR